MATVVRVNDLKTAFRCQLGCYTFCSKGGKEVSKLIDELPTFEVSYSGNCSYWQRLEGFFNRVRCSGCSSESVQATPFCPNCGSPMANYSER